MFFTNNILLAVPPCSSYNNCTDCLNDVNEQCGWCKSDNICIPRSEGIRCSDFQENSCDG